MSETKFDSIGYCEKERSRRWTKSFAIVSVAIMILMSFQVMSFNSSASTEDSALGVGEDGESSYDSADQNDTADQAEVDAQEPDMPLDAQGITWDVGGGSVESYGGYSEPIISVPAIVLPKLDITTHEDEVIVKSTTGRYSVDMTRPWSIGLSDSKEAIVVSESFFTLESDGVILEIGGGEVAEVTSRSIDILYDILSPETPSEVAAQMSVMIDFLPGTPPKITAEVLSVSDAIGDWRVVWIVVPASVAYVLGESALETTPLSGYVHGAGGVSRLSLRMAVGGPSSDDVFDMDWSDAQEGTPSVIEVESGLAVKVAFSPGRKVIDPTIVSSSDSSTPTDLACQRKLVWHGGYYWLFYDDASAIRYRRSGDGRTWSSEFTMPESTALAPGFGFDVAARDGKVAVAWIDYGENAAYLKSGTFVGNKVVWNQRSVVTTLGACMAPVSATIGTDGVYSVFVQWRMIPGYLCFSVFRSSDGISWSSIGPALDYAYSNSDTWNVILPFGDGDLVLVESSDAYSKVRVRYWLTEFGISSGWTAPVEHDIGLAAGDKGDKFSIVSKMDGSVHIALKASDNDLRYAVIWPAGVKQQYDITATDIVGWPAISLDPNDDLHIYWINTTYTIRHVQKTGDNVAEWSAADTFCTDYSASIRGLTSLANPVVGHALAYTAPTSPCNVVFASKPLPYGTPGAAAEPWNRDGLSPYQTYFSTFNDYVSSGSGLLTLLQNDVSVAGRGVDLSISRIYQQPRYFRDSGAAGVPYMSYSYPACNLGPYWSLDLPWMDDTFVYTGNGERFLIQWGNNGDDNEFENHDGTHFVLRYQYMSYPMGQWEFYELIFASGMRYVFDYDSPYELQYISDLRGYDPFSHVFVSLDNSISVGYDAYGRISELEESDAGRTIQFTYNGYGLLGQIIRPDLDTITFGYTSVGGRYALTSVTDAKDRVTTFTYESSTYDYLLKEVRFPTGAKNVYTYAKDYSAGTEVRSELVTTQKTVDATSGVLIRQTDYNYKISSGKVTFVTVTERDENGVVQGYVESVFESDLMYSSDTTKDGSGTQLSKTVTWFDDAGQPVRVDTYKGASTDVSYTEYNAYDDWGNVIFTRDALGHESYTSYASTKTQNSFQGGGLLQRTTSGKIMYDSFDDWNISDWDVVVSTGNTVTLDGAVSLSGSTPSMNVKRTASGSAQASKSFTPQSTDFIIQAKMMMDDSSRSYLLGMSSTGGYRIYFWGSGSSFTWFDGSEHTVPGVSLTLGEWYDIAFHAHPQNNTYEIFIDGQYRVHANMYGTSQSPIDFIQVQAYYSATVSASIWIDEVRIYKSLSVSVSMGTGYVAELYDSKGDLVDRSKSGALTIPKMPLSYPPGYIEVTKIGDYSFKTAMMDIWGGDSYTLSTGYRKASVEKDTVGFGRAWSSIINDGWPTSGATIFQGGDYVVTDCAWVSDTDYAVSGTSYHESAYADASHYHGFVGGASMLVPDTNVLVQYVWLTEGKMPREIMVQYCIGGVWKRAYWGGGGSNEDLITLEDHTQYEPLSSNVKRVGDIPQTTGEWVQLTVKISELGVSGTQSITGVAFGLYGGTARWDYTSRMSTGVYVWGLSSTNSVKLFLDDGTYVQSTGYNPAILFPYDSGKKTYPISGYFRVYDGGTTVYTSPWFEEIWNMDEYDYSAPSWYVNSVKDGSYDDPTGYIHDRAVGSFEYQDYAKTVKQETYTKYSDEGDAVETKANLGSGWVVSKAGYDSLGNLLWSSDPTGRGESYEYSGDYVWTYPTGHSLGSAADTLEGDQLWYPFEYGSGGYTDWMNSQYTEARSYSPTHSMIIEFNSGPMSYDTGYASMILEAGAKPVDTISLKYYCEEYYHNGGSSGEYLDAGIKVQLVDETGTIYSTYKYWLACWQGSANNRTAPDAYTKVIWGQPPMNTWLNVELHMSTDFVTPPDWTNCAWVKIEFYLVTSWAYADRYKGYIDDVSMFGDYSGYQGTTYTYDFDTGNVLSQTDSLGRDTSYEYDELGRITKVTHDDLTFSTTVYDDVSNKATSYDELNRKTVQSFDKIGRLVKVERYGLGSTVHSYVQYTYDWRDQVVSYRDLGGHVMEYQYDFLGRPIRVDNPDTTYSTISYDDATNTVTKTDENGHKLATVSDDLGRHVKTHEYYSSSSYYETLMTYDAVGNLLTVKDGRLKVTTMTYDSLNRMTSISYPDLESESQTFDAAGRVKTKTDRSGQVTTSVHDAAGQIVKMVSEDDTFTTMFDAAGQITKKTNSLASIEYSYDNRGMMESMTETIGGTAYDMSFGYSDVGEMTSITYPDSTTLTYEYDDYDRVTHVKKGTTNLLSYTYRIDDLMLTEATNGGQETTIGYNLRDWPTSIVMKMGSQTKLSMSYDYDGVGNVETIDTESYAYDWLNRLTSATGSWGTITYGYDAVGNRLWMNDGTYKSYSYDDYNKLTSSTGWSYAYDDNGNLVERTSSAVETTYTYDSLNRMTGVENWEYVLKGKKGKWVLVGDLEFLYDANGARARTVEGATTTDYVYLSHDPYYETAGGDPTIYIYVSGRLEAKIAGTSTYYYVQDALGSTRQVWKEGVTVKADSSVSTYLPFGIPVTLKGSEEFLYAGEMLEAGAGESGLYYLFARFMDPGLGRFVSMDSQLGSLSVPQTLNRYVYCVNNPLRITDPTGEWLNIVIGAVVGAVVNTVVYAVTTGDLSLEGLATAAVTGAVVGAVAGATLGTSLIAQRAISGVVTGAVSAGIDIMGQVASGKSIDWKSVGGSFAGGFAAGFLGGGKTAGKTTIKSFAQKANSLITKAVGKEMPGLATAAGIAGRGIYKGSLGVTGGLASGLVSGKGTSDSDMFLNFAFKGAAGYATDPWNGPSSGTAYGYAENSVWMMWAGIGKWAAKQLPGYSE